MREVAVVGAGIAGFAAALGAKDAGAKVRVFDAHAGGSSFASGAWDVASPTDRHGTDGLPESIAIAEGVEVLAAACASHPYARLGEQRVEHVLVAHRRVLGALPSYEPLPTMAPHVVYASELGILRCAATAQRSILRLERAEHRPIAVAGLRWAGARPDGAFDADFVARSLSSAWERVTPKHFFSLSVKCDWDGLVAVRHLHEIAYELDGDGSTEKFADALSASLQGHEIGGVLLPSILGMNKDGLAESLSAKVGVPVGEALSALTSPQSLRLASAIDRALDREQITRTHHRVASIHRSADGPVLVFDDGAQEHVGAVVLATGKYVGGGIAYAEGAPREPIAGLPIFLDGVPLRAAALASGFDPLAMFGSDPFSRGAGFRLGVGYDDEFRAFGSDGRTLSDVFVCGAILDGVDPAREGGGFGCAATTGYLAGRAAASR